MARIFLAEKNSKFDLAPARKFGQIVFLSSTPMNPFNTGDLVNLFKAGLHKEHFNRDTDYICLTGVFSIICIFLAVAIKLHGSVKVLMFDAKETEYRERVIEI